MNKIKISNIFKLASADFKHNFLSDFIAGFLVFLLALPLSIGIAQASDFEPIYGLITAMIGGFVVAFFSGSPLSIKGPAAGLIVLVASSVSDFGGGETGWRLTLGVIIASGILQLIFGFFKLGVLSEIFPYSVVKGMLAAIGFIILSKQIHGLIGHNPLNENGKPIIEPIELFYNIPKAFHDMNFKAFLVGILSLFILVIWPYITQKKFKNIPAPLIMLIIIIPFSFAIGLDNIKNVNGAPVYYINFNQGLSDVLKPNASFNGLDQMSLFLKHTLIFAIIGSLESLLTVKAIGLLDVTNKKSNPNKDLIAIGFGNILAGFFGGLPMISEVARSSANITYGAKSLFANFYHGLVMLVFLVFAVTFSDLIPKPALAAILISVAIKLVNPNQFVHVLKIGKEQLMALIITIIFTLTFDLLIGIFAGIVFKLIFLFANGLNFSNLFKATYEVTHTKDVICLKIKNSVVFTNYHTIKKKLDDTDSAKKLIIDISEIKIIDATAHQNIKLFLKSFEKSGGIAELIGLDNLSSQSNHPFAMLKQKPMRF